ncbi:MAG: tRNA (adenosine(37)-N6)-threonylcarbamoyltransferase complex transferase subunit TsaD [Planctomycetota bacterium]
MKILGIETTCDETSAAVVSEGPRLLGQVVLSQASRHGPFGGVVPEIACRAHVETLTQVIEKTLLKSGVRPRDLSGIAVAYRPGLIGALLVGITTAKSLAWAWQLPLLGVDHLEAHLEAPALAGHTLNPPFLGVVLSGGHTDIYRVTEDRRERLGSTRDDAIGEAFDKVAAILGLGYPGGPALEREAAGGDPRRVSLPRTLLSSESLDFSFSGIKTAVLYLWRGQDAKSPGPVPGAPKRADVAAGFQAAVSDVVVEKLSRALRRTGLRRVVCGGGVTANQTLRKRLEDGLADEVDELVFPPPELATDNGAMIAAVGLRKLARGEMASLDLEAEST